MSGLLFDVPRNKTRLQVLKELHGIETHDCNLQPGDERWLAICRPKVIEALSGYGVKNEMPLFGIFAGYCRLLEEGGLISFGETEADAVIDCCANNGIACVL